MESCDTNQLFNSAKFSVANELLLLAINCDRLVVFLSSRALSRFSSQKEKLELEKKLSNLLFVLVGYL